MDTSSCGACVIGECRSDCMAKSDCNAVSITTVPGGVTCELSLSSETFNTSLLTTTDKSHSVTTHVKGGINVLDSWEVSVWKRCID